VGEEAAAYGRRLSGASMGLIGAVGALGGVGINLAFRQSFLSYGSGTGAFVAFLAFYGVCFVVTWAVYLRRPAGRITASGTASEAKPQLSYAEV
jgi:NNP family nitrate/nitrite transporter-like MFS transporter